MNTTEFVNDRVQCTFVGKSLAQKKEEDLDEEVAG